MPPVGTGRVIEWLRSDVPRPNPRHLVMVELRVAADGGLDKGGDAPRWNTPRGPTCPLGLLPSATRGEPCIPEHTGRDFTDREVCAFIDWWDSLTLAQARLAVGLIWPKKKIARTRGGRA